MEDEVGKEYRSEDELEDMLSQLDDDTQSLISDASSTI